MGERVTILHGDCMAVLPTLPADSVHAVVTDPPYALVSITKRFGADDAAPAKSNGATGVYQRASAGFMGAKWDTGKVAFDPALWREVLRVLKPGGHVLAFGGTRTYHRLACAVEDAGFEIRDAIMWHYGSGFPKSHDVSKGIDRAAGASGTQSNGASGKGATTVNSYGDGLNVGFAERPQYTPATDTAREWQGWGTALKPATEIIVLARKPLGKSTVAANVQAFGTGALNIDGCRVDAADEAMGWETPRGGIWATDSAAKAALVPSGKGRWPANICHDGSEEVLRAFPESESKPTAPVQKASNQNTIGLGINNGPRSGSAFEDSGSAARFFYTSKADAADRLGSKHPTVKPVDLVAYLCRLICPPGGTILDPFAGSGTTAMACMREGFNAILIERELEYVTDARRRIAHVSGQDAPLFAGAL